MAHGESATSATRGEVHSPGTVEEIIRLVKSAHDDNQPLEIKGSGSLSGYGRAMQTGATLSLSNLTGVTLYEPKELVISARAGTPLLEVEALLRENRQMFAFEPPHHFALFGGASETATMGGIVATNRSGPRRVISGAARDGLIGVNFINGKGEFNRAGGRVMKNVTGYDLTKLQAGAHGSLGVLTDVTFKLVPMPETEATLLFSGLALELGIAAMSSALGSSFEASAAALLPREGGDVVALRLEGFATPLKGRIEVLAAHLSAFGAPEILHGEASAALWRDVRDVKAFVADDAALWRISTVPSAASAIIAQLEPYMVSRPLLDWGGGLIWLPVADEGGAKATQVRAAIPRGKGHATLYRASLAVRRAAGPFQPLDKAQEMVNTRVKEAFDPARIINPNVMYDGI